MRMDNILQFVDKVWDNVNTIMHLLAKKPSQLVQLENSSDSKYTQCWDLKSNFWAADFIGQKSFPAPSILQ